MIFYKEKIKLLLFLISTFFIFRMSIIRYFWEFINFLFIWFSIFSLLFVLWFWEQLIKNFKNFNIFFTKYLFKFNIFLSLLWILFVFWKWKIEFYWDDIFITIIYSLPLVVFLFFFQWFQIISLYRNFKDKKINYNFLIISIFVLYIYSICILSSLFYSPLEYF